MIVDDGPTAAAEKGSREMENPDEQRYNSLESSKTPGGNHKSYRVNMRFANVNRSGTVCSMKERLSNYFDEPSSRDISTYTMNLDGSSRMSTPLFNVTVGHTPSPGLLNMRKFQDTNELSRKLRKEQREKTKQRKSTKICVNKNEMSKKSINHEQTAPPRSLLLQQQQLSDQECSDAEYLDKADYADKLVRKSIQEARDVIMDTDDEEVKRSEVQMRLPSRLFTPTMFNVKVGRTPTPILMGNLHETGRERRRSVMKMNVVDHRDFQSPTIFNLKISQTPTRDVTSHVTSRLSHHNVQQADYELQWKGTTSPDKKQENNRPQPDGHQEHRSELNIRIGEKRPFTPNLFNVKLQKSSTPPTPIPPTPEIDPIHPQPQRIESLTTKFQLTKPLNMLPDELPKPAIPENQRSVFNMQLLGGRRTASPMNFRFQKPADATYDTADSTSRAAILLMERPTAPEPLLQEIETQTSPLPSGEDELKHHPVQKYLPSVYVNENSIYDETTTKRTRGSSRDEIFNDDRMSTMPIPPADPSGIKEKALVGTSGSNKVVLVETTETTTRTRIKQDGKAKLQVKEEEIRYEVFSPVTGEKYVTTVKQDQEQNKGKLKVKPLKTDFDKEEVAWMIDDTKDRARITELTDDDLRKEARPSSRMDPLLRPASCDCVRTESPGAEKFSKRRRWNPRTRAFEIKFVDKSPNNKDRFNKIGISGLSTLNVAEKLRLNVLETSSIADSTTSQSEEIAALMDEDECNRSSPIHRPVSSLSQNIFKRPASCEGVRVDSPGMLKAGYRRRWNPRRRGFEIVFVGEPLESPLAKRTNPTLSKLAESTAKEKEKSEVKEEVKPIDAKSKMQLMKQDYLASMNDRRQMRFFIQEQQEKKKQVVALDEQIVRKSSGFDLDVGQPIIEEESVEVTGKTEEKCLTPAPVNEPFETISMIDYKKVC